ncbi:uncharacterized protein [Anabrus simplex]|uniref:uncharacterized protein n=1 Tax=Anabrus simplex TaxID=316456 RepID=UPI0035A37E8F
MVLFTSSSVMHYLLPQRQFHGIQTQDFLKRNLLYLKVSQTGEMMDLKPVGHVPTRLFSPDRLNKNPAVWPIVGLLGMWAVGLVGYSVYAFLSRDVEYTKSMKSRAEQVDLLLNPRPNKLLTINEKYRPMPELHELYKEMDQARACSSVNKE